MAKKGKKSQFLILGADGQQGIIAARYLTQKGYKVAVADIYCETIEKESAKNKVKLEYAFCDHRHTIQIENTIRRFNPDVVINCADDYYNDKVFDACLKMRVPHVDLGSDIAGTARRMDRFAEFEKAGIIAIMGCGSTPGIGSVMLRHIAEKFEIMREAEAGFVWDSNMKDFVPPFFLFVVTLELSQPVTIMQDGKIVHLPPKSEPRIQKFPLLNDQQVYLVPHSEPYTFHRYFQHKGLNNVKFFAGFPHHSRDVVDSLIKLGFQYNKPIDVLTDDGLSHVHPCDFLTVMAKKIDTPEGYEESEVLWVKVTGVENGAKTISEIEMRCIVPPIKGWESYGCNVDTAFPACIIAEMVRDGNIKDKGVFCPEGVVPCEPFFKRIMAEGMKFETTRITKEP